MIDTGSRDATIIVPQMREYMVEHGINIEPVKYYGGSTYAVLNSKSSIGYRKKSVKWNKTGIVFFCIKEDADNLTRALPLKVESPLNDSDPARPYPVFIPDQLFEQAVEVMKKNPLNERSASAQKSGSYQNMFWDDYYPHVKKCLLRDGYSNSDGNTKTTVCDTFYLERHDARDFLSWFESEESFERAKERIAELLTAANRKSSNLKTEIKYYTRDLGYFAEFRGLKTQGKKESEQSKYRVIGYLGNKKHVKKIERIEDGKIFVQKELENCNKDVYQRLIDEKIEGLPRIYGMRSSGNKLVTAEEYISGLTLEERIQKKGLPSEKEIEHIILELCKILRRMHNLTPPLIHRDIKPSNIIMTDAGKIYLIDFNASKEYHAGMSEDTVFAGTYGFAAPEQQGAYGYQSSCPADVYGVGATLNYLLTKMLPGQIIPAGKYKKLIEKCVKMNPEDRYQTIDEFETTFRSLC